MNIQKHKILFIICVISILIGLIVGFTYFILPYLNYENRTFTLTQRLLTEPRIILFYLSQLFYPLASRLSLEHDIIISTSITNTWATIPAILSCLLLIGLGLVTMKKTPFFSFAILFFFLNHMIESTVLPLELIFEHRNYLPSLFLFLPISALVITSIENCRSHSRYARPILIVGTITLLIFFGVNTYSRNQVWSSELLLMKDAYHKAPNNSRAAPTLQKNILK